MQLILLLSNKLSTDSEKSLFNIFLMKNNYSSVVMQIIQTSIFFLHFNVLLVALTSDIISSLRHRKSFNNVNHQLEKKFFHHF